MALSFEGGYDENAGEPDGGLNPATHEGGEGHGRVEADGGHV